MLRFSYLVLAAAAAHASVPAQAQTAVDGDTIKLNGTTWRLWGIDARELDQTCGDWRADIDATYALAGLMRSRTIVSELRGHDRYGRSIGLCRADGRDLGAAMVERGYGMGFHPLQLGPRPGRAGRHWRAAH